MKTWILAITLTLAGVALLAGPAAAKGPLEVEISGGDLDAPVPLEGTVPAQVLFPETPKYIDAPIPYPQNIYTLRFSASGQEVGQISYYPAHDGLAAALRDDRGNFLPVPAELATVLDGAPVNAKTVAEEGDDESFSLAWLAIPGLLGAVVVGGGIAGVLRKRKA